MKIRPFAPSDGEATYKLFCKTVHTVNRADYSPEQLDAWADGKRDISGWTASFDGRTSLVAEQGGRIIGFGDITDEGYLDRLYVAHGFTGRGVGGALCDALEEPFTRIEVHASITAKPFFERRGYKTVRPNTVIRKGVELTNFIMVKDK